jgi:hypothetical protein
MTPERKGRFGFSAAIMDIGFWKVKIEDGKGFEGR